MIKYCARYFIASLAAILYCQIATGYSDTKTSLKPFVAEYDIYHLGIPIARGQRSLERVNMDTYRMVARINTSGFIGWFKKVEIVEHSLLQSDGTALHSLEYEYRRTGSNKPRHVVIDFDRQQNKIINIVNGNHWQMELTEEQNQSVVDKLLYQLAVVQELAVGNNPQSFLIADGGKLKTYLHYHHGTELIDTSYGQQETIKLEQYKNSDQKRKVIMWIAPNLDYQPVKISYTNKKGGTFLVLLDSLKFPSADGAEQPAKPRLTTKDSKTILGNTY